MRRACGGIGRGDVGTVDGHAAAVLLEDEVVLLRHAKALECLRPLLAERVGNVEVW